MKPRSSAPFLHVLIALSLFAGQGCGRAPESPITMRLLEVGVAKPAGQQRRVDNSTSATGFVSKGDAVIQTTGTLVPATQGTTFGLAYRLDGVRRGQAFRITHVLRHPPMTKPDGSQLTEQISYEDVVGDGGPIEGKFWYILREAYEVVPGTWTVTLQNGSTILLTQQFTVGHSS